MTEAAPIEAARVRQVIDELGISGIVDVHTHFMPRAVMDKVWDYFDNAGENYGIEWPIEYRQAETERLATLRSFGVTAFTSMVYAHKPGMAKWLNEWAAEFARKNSDCLYTATFFPEPGVDNYVAQAIGQGARVFKVHIQVGEFSPVDPLLDGVWGQLSEAGISTVIHCGSGPLSGKFTGPGPIRELLSTYPNLPLIIAHMGAPEYGEFLELADKYEEVRLDTTMAFTDFMNQLAPFPPELLSVLREAGERGDILFGSDFPNIPYPFIEQIESLQRLDLGDDFMRRVLHDSGARLFR